MQIRRESDTEVPAEAQQPSATLQTLAITALIGFAISPGIPIAILFVLRLIAGQTLVLEGAVTVIVLLLLIPLGFFAISLGMGLALRRSGKTEKLPDKEVAGVIGAIGIITYIVFGSGFAMLSHVLIGGFIGAFFLATRRDNTYLEAFWGTVLFPISLLWLAGKVFGKVFGGGKSGSGEVTPIDTSHQEEEARKQELRDQARDAHDRNQQNRQP